MPLYPPFPAATTSTAGLALLDGTAADITAEGTQSAGAVGRAADSGHVHPAYETVPADHGLLAWAYSIDSAVQTFAAIAGTVYLSKIPIRANLTATNLWYSVSSAGSGSSTGSFVGLYSSAGSLLSGSADLGASISVANHEVALTTPQSLTAGTFVWAAIITNQASTQPSIRTIYNSQGQITPNLNLAAASFRIAVPGSGGTSQTALPLSFTPSALTNTGAVPYWFGIS